MTSTFIQITVSRVLGWLWLVLDGLMVGMDGSWLPTSGSVVDIRASRVGVSGSSVVVGDYG